MEAAEWEYRFETRNLGGLYDSAKEEAERHMSQMARAGWELVSTSVLRNDPADSGPEMADEYANTIDMVFTWRRTIA